MLIQFLLDIRANLIGFIPDNILNRVRYRVGGGGDLTLQVNAIRYGEAAAITLDYVVIFKEQNGALYNPTLWAHELTHVGQYQSWGIHDFAFVTFEVTRAWSARLMKLKHATQLG